MCHWLRQTWWDEGFGWKVECWVSVPFGGMRGQLFPAARHFLPHVGATFGSMGREGRSSALSEGQPWSSLTGLVDASRGTSRF